MTHPLVRHLAAEGFRVHLTCGVLGFSTQAFLAWNTTRFRFGTCRTRTRSTRSLMRMVMTRRLVTGS